MVSQSVKLKKLQISDTSRLGLLKMCYFLCCHTIVKWDLQGTPGCCKDVFNLQQRAKLHLLEAHEIFLEVFRDSHQVDAALCLSLNTLQDLWNCVFSYWPFHHPSLSKQRAKAVPLDCWEKKLCPQTRLLQAASFQFWDYSSSQPLIIKKKQTCWTDSSRVT